MKTQTATTQQEQHSNPEAKRRGIKAFRLYLGKDDVYTFESRSYIELTLIQLSILFFDSMNVDQYKYNLDTCINMAIAVKNVTNQFNS